MSQNPAGKSDEMEISFLPSSTSSIMSKDDGKGIWNENGNCESGKHDDDGAVFERTEENVNIENHPPQNSGNHQRQSSQQSAHHQRLPSNQSAHHQRLPSNQSAHHQRMPSQQSAAEAMMQALPQHTEHQSKAKSLLQQVLMEHRVAAAAMAMKPPHQHRKTASRVPQLIPEIYQQQQQQQDQQQAQPDDPTRAQSPPPGQSHAPPEPMTPDSQSVDSREGGPAPPQEKTSLADTAQYLIALHHHHEDHPPGVPHSNSNNKDSIPDYNAAAPLAPARDAYMDDDEDRPPVESIHPADRVYAAAAVLKAASRFNRGRPKKTDGPPVPVVNTNTSAPGDVENPAANADAGTVNYRSDDDDTDGGSTSSGGRRPSWIPGNGPPRRQSGKRKGRRAKFGQALAAVKQEWNSLNDFFQPNGQNMRDQFVFVCWALILPCLAVSVILFYFVGNPPTGRCRNNKPCGLDDQGEPVTSASWWVLFLGVRQVCTWMLARLSDVFFFDWMVLQHPRIIRLLGPQISLVIIQSKGWPSVIFWWALWDIMILHGKGAFNHHWLYWQDEIKIFTSENPSGDIPMSEFYRHVLITMIVVALSVSFKRYILSLYLGRRLHARFNDRLSELMEEIALISELSLWARRKRDQRATYSVWSSIHAEKEERAMLRSSMASGGKATYGAAGSRAMKRFSMTPQYTNQNSMVSEDAIDYDKLLEKWSEPKRGHGGEVHASKIIEFRQAFAVMTKPFFFSSAFGPVESRKECINSADRLFRRLLKLFEDDETIDVNQLLHWMFKGCHLPGQKEKSSHLILLLNPDADNRLNIVDFVRGIDAVYQRVRLLENAVHNASHIDREYEKILNFLFYFILICVALAILRLDPLTLLLTVSGLIVAVSFMIGPGSAVFFEGIMMVLGRQPYDVGDRIAIAGVSDMPDFDGSTQWQIENVDLLSTTARLVWTNEVANFSNGALARSRLINMNRSPDPIVYVYVRFQTDVPYSTITIFRSALEIFVEDRPQEWEALLGFRTSRVEAQLNFVEYIVILQHRLSWQSLIPIKESRAAVASFCVEIQKQLGCHYSAPPMPVEITMNSDLPMTRVDSSMENLMATAKQFEAKKDD